MRYMLATILVSVANFFGLASAMAADTLRVGFSSDMPPYVIEASASGIEVDIVRAAGKAAGLAVTPHFFPMGRLTRMLETGEIDAIATTNLNDKTTPHQSAEYVEFRNYAVALASRKLEVKAIADLGKYSVSAFQRADVLLGPEFEAMARANPRYREEADQIVRNRLLFTGRIDLIVGDRRIIEHFNRAIRDKLDTSRPLAWYPLFPPTRYRIGFRDAALRDRFDDGLAAIQKNGAHAEIIKRHAGK